jgi:hypothetical protein
MLQTHQRTAASVLLRFNDTYLYALRAYQAGVRQQDSSLMEAARQALLPLQFIRNHILYSRLSLLDYLLEKVCLQDESLAFYKLFSSVNMSGVAGHSQGLDAVHEEDVRGLIGQVHDADSTDAWVAANLRLGKQESVQKSLDKSLGVKSNREFKRQRVEPEMRDDILAITTRVRQFFKDTVNDSRPQQLAGLLLSKDAGNLTAIGRQRIKDVHGKYIAKGRSLFEDGIKWAPHVATVVLTDARGKIGKAAQSAPAGPRKLSGKRKRSSPKFKAKKKQRVAAAGTVCWCMLCFRCCSDSSCACVCCVMIISQDMDGQASETEEDDEVAPVDDDDWDPRDEAAFEDSLQEAIRMSNSGRRKPSAQRKSEEDKMTDDGLDDAPVALFNAKRK